jgi:Ca-activated chloride channel family protein
VSAYRFEAPLALLLILALPVLIWWLRQLRDGPSLRFSSLAIVGDGQPSMRARLRPLLFALRVLAFFLIIVALARPQRGEANANVERRGIDIVISQDLSGSMSENYGGQESRLDSSRRLAAAFVHERKDDRIGLIGFESETRTLSPLTEDHDALAQIISRMQNGQDGLPDGTAIGEGLTSAINLLRGSDSRSRIIVLLTDGEENVHTIEPQQAAQLAKTLGIRVYTVGIVSPRSQAVDVNALKSISSTTGGAFFTASSPQALSDVYQQINKLEKSTVVVQHYYRWDELAPWLIVPAIMLLAIEALLANTVLRLAP